MSSTPAARHRRIMRAVLPHPPGINRTYATQGGRWYKTHEAARWQEHAFLQLRSAGFHSHPPGPYFVGLEITLWTVRHDVDGKRNRAVN